MKTRRIRIGPRGRYAVTVDARDFAFLTQWKWTYVRLGWRYGASIYARRRVRVNGRSRCVEEFESKIWQPYPRTPVMSKEQAWRAWRRASDADRAAIIAAIPCYAAWLRRKKPDHPVLNVATFIAQRRFEGFAAAAAPPARGYYAASESPQLAAWDAHRRATRGRRLPRDQYGGWWVDAEWPPGHAAHSGAPDPPDGDAAA